MTTRILHLRLGSIPCEESADHKHYFLQIGSPATSGIQAFNTTYPFAIPRIDLESLSEAIEKAVLSPKASDRGVLGNAYQCYILPDGERMYKAFPNNFQLLFNGFWGELTHAADDNLLVLLQLEESASDLTMLPWEMLLLPGGAANDFLIADPARTIARYIPGKAIQKGGYLPGQKLKMLIVHSRFGLSGAPDPRMQKTIANEWRIMKDVLQSGSVSSLVELIRLRDPTLPELARILNNGDINIFHYTGHGDNKPGPHIMLRDSDDPNRGTQVGWDLLQPAFRQASSLQLVLLNACHQAHLVSNLVKLGIPAVISMSYEIGAQVVTHSGGFTSTFYQEIAGGNVVHVAYARALSSIWYASAVQAFIPMLSLGTMSNLVLLDPKSEQVREVSREAEKRRLAALQLAKHIETPIDTFVQGRTRQDFERARAVLNELSADEASIHEPEVIAQLEKDIARIDSEQKSLQNQERWFEAQRCNWLQNQLVHLLPIERRPLKIDDGSGIDARAQDELGRMRQEISRLHEEMQWKKLFERTKAYLDIDPENQSVETLYAEAQKVMEVEQQIKLVDDESLSEVLDIEDLLQGETPEEVTQAIKHLSGQLPPDTSIASIWQELMEQAAYLDPSLVLAYVRAFYQLDPQNDEVRAALFDALYEEAQQFRRARQWDDAERDCYEMIRLVPQSDKALGAQLDKARNALLEVLREHMQDARLNYNWEAVRTVTTRILEESHFSNMPIYAEAQQLHNEAEAILKLMFEIKLSDLPESDSSEGDLAKSSEDDPHKRIHPEDDSLEEE